MKAQAVQAVIATMIGSLLSFSWAEETLPADVQKVVDQRSDAIAKIDKIYLQELDKLKLKYTKQGDLDAANTIVALMKQVGLDQSQGIQNAAIKPFIGKWISKQEQTSRESFVTISGTHFIDDESGTRHPFVVEGNSIRIFWGGSHNEWLLITSQPGKDKVMRGVNFEGTRFSFTKVEK